MAEETQRQATPREALNAVDQWLGKLSGPGIDRAAHIQMQAAVQIIEKALPTEGTAEATESAEPQP
jgi:hypothetical protein